MKKIKAPRTVKSWQDLRGLSHQPMTNQRGFKGGKLGAASAGKRLSAAERQAVEQQMRDEGKL